MTDESAVQMLKDMVVAFNRHDLDAFMTQFTENAVFESPRGPESWGRRYEGKQAVREAMEGRIRDIPNVQYGQAHISSPATEASRNGR